MVFVALSAAEHAEARAVPVAALASRQTTAVSGKSLPMTSPARTVNRPRVFWVSPSSSSIQTPIFRVVYHSCMLFFVKPTIGFCAMKGT